MPYKDKENQKGHYLKNKESYYFRNVKNRFKLSQEDYGKLFFEQNGQCALCSKTFQGLDRRNIHVDHCHDTGKIRGLLCMPCNVGLGMLGDNVEGLEKALRYIKGNAQ